MNHFGFNDFLPFKTQFPGSGKNTVEKLLVSNFWAWLPVWTGRGC